MQDPDRELEEKFLKLGTHGLNPTKLSAAPPSDSSPSSLGVDDDLDDLLDDGDDFGWLPPSTSAAAVIAKPITTIFVKRKPDVGQVDPAQPLIPIAGKPLKSTEAVFLGEVLPDLSAFIAKASPPIIGQSESPATTSLLPKSTLAYDDRSAEGVLVAAESKLTLLKAQLKALLVDVRNAFAPRAPISSFLWDRCLDLMLMSFILDGIMKRINFQEQSAKETFAALDKRFALLGAAEDLMAKVDDIKRTHSQVYEKAGGRFLIGKLNLFLDEAASSRAAVADVVSGKRSVDEVAEVLQLPLQPAPEKLAALLAFEKSERSQNRQVNAPKAPWQLIDVDDSSTSPTHLLAPEILPIVPATSGATPPALDHLLSDFKAPENPNSTPPKTIPTPLPSAPPLEPDLLAPIFPKHSQPQVASLPPQAPASSLNLSQVTPAQRPAVPSNVTVLPSTKLASRAPYAPQAPPVLPSVVPPSLPGARDIHPVPEPRPTAPRPPAPSDPLPAVRKAVPIDPLSLEGGRQGITLEKERQESAPPPFVPKFDEPRAPKSTPTTSVPAKLAPVAPVHPALTAPQPTPAAPIASPSSQIASQRIPSHPASATPTHMPPFSAATSAPPPRGSATAPLPSLFDAALWKDVSPSKPNTTPLVYQDLHIKADGVVIPPQPPTPLQLQQAPPLVPQFKK